MEVVLEELFAAYEEINAAADATFAKIQRDYSAAVRCTRGCADCCYAVFGLFLVEAVYLRSYFGKLPAAVQEEILRRAEQAEEEIRLVQKRLNYYTNDPVMQAYALSRQRVRCPLLNAKDECMLYPHRPVTCRVYGIPVAVRGRAQVCWKASFERGKEYPTFNLDAAYRELYRLSALLLAEANLPDAAERASLLISVAKTLQTPAEALIRGELA
ncbi:YkgJ family cysteine cluster protein [Thermodesulfitimonas sp.]